VVYEIGYRDRDGRQRWETVDGGLKAARARRASVVHRRDGLHQRVAPTPRLMFNAAADRWWEGHVVRLRPNTQSAYRAALLHLRRHFGRRRLSDITAEHVAGYVTAMQAERKGWTVKGHLTALSGVYRYAGRRLGFAGETR
jgi:hypothetical protein